MRPRVAGRVLIDCGERLLVHVQHPFPASLE